MSNTIDDPTNCLPIAKSFREYLEHPYPTSCVEQLIVSSKTRFTLNLEHMSEHSPHLLKLILSQPILCFEILSDTLNAYMKHLQDENRLANVVKDSFNYTFAFEGSTAFGLNQITPRGLNAYTLNKLVMIEGIVTKISIVRARLIQSAHYCEKTQSSYIRKYYDQYNIFEHRTQNDISESEGESNDLSTAEYGYCKYKDHQVLVIQDMPEQMTADETLCSVEVVLEDELVDTVKPGDRAKTTLIATNISVLATKIKSPQLTPKDVVQIRKFAGKADIFDVLSNAIIPSVYGHEYLKKAILLMLIGSKHKTGRSQSDLRENIHVLIVGDPSTAKSQFLRGVLNLAPLAVSVNGKMCCDGGLTARVRLDKKTGQKYVEAGTMVMADLGIVCIDEFDKFEKREKLAVQEVMEEQKVIIYKGYLNAVLNARCSVIASASSKYGKYQEELSVRENIGLFESLVSRFDLIFVIKDEKYSENDQKIAEKVIMNHRYQYEEQEAGICEEEQEEALSQELLKKYVSYAKNAIIPEMSVESIEFLSKQWSQLRQRNWRNDRSAKLAITIRTFESLMRLATAHAKLRLSEKVEILDCEQALELLNFTLKRDGEGLGKKDNREEKKGWRDEYGLIAKKIKKTANRKNKENEEKENLNKNDEEKIEITEELMKVVFKEFVVISYGRCQITEVELWDRIKKGNGSQTEDGKRIAGNRVYLREALDALDKKNKLMYHREMKVIHKI